MGPTDASARVLGIVDVTARFASAVGVSAERLDLVLRRWPVAAILLLNLAILLAALLLATG
jgi:hypothetical protein